MVVLLIFQAEAKPKNADSDVMLENDFMKVSVAVQGK